MDSTSSLRTALALAVATPLALATLTLPACGPGDGPGDDGTSYADMALPPSPPTPAAVTALQYDVRLDLATRVARVSVTLRVDQPGNCVTIGFRAGDPSEVTFDDQPASPGETVVAGGKLTACRDGHRPWAALDITTLGATAEVPKTTVNNSQVGFSVRNDANGKPFTYLVSWVGGCDHHGLCDAAPDRFASYRFVVDAAAGEQVLCPGTITVSGNRTVCEFTRPGGPTYSTFGLAAGRSWTPKSLGSWDGIDVTLYDYPQTKIADTIDSAALGQFMKWMQSLLGPYPYGKELRLVIAPTYWLGFEHPGNIVLSQNLVTQAGQIPWVEPLRHVVMHEVAHQWAGDYSTLADTYDFFWKEATAEYLTQIYEEENLGANAGQSTADYWKGAAAAARYYPVPGEKPPLFTYYGDAYGAGPMVLYRQLEVMYSRAVVVAAIQKLLSTVSPPRALGVDDFRKALEQTTGAKLSGYFDAWMRGKGAPAWPTAKVTTTDVGGGLVKVEVAVKTSDGVARGCAFKVRLHDNDKGVFDVPVNLGPDSMAFTPVMVNPGFTVTGADVDPKSECLIFGASGPRKPRPPVNPWLAPAE